MGLSSDHAVSFRLTVVRRRRHHRRSFVGHQLDIVVRSYLDRAVGRYPGLIPVRSKLWVPYLVTNWIAYTGSRRVSAMCCQSANCVQVSHGNFSYAGTTNESNIIWHRLLGKTKNMEPVITINLIFATFISRSRFSSCPVIYNISSHKITHTEIILLRNNE